jgi:hypothetical protein
LYRRTPGVNIFPSFLNFYCFHIYLVENNVFVMDVIQSVHDQTTVFVNSIKDISYENKNVKYTDIIIIISAQYCFHCFLLPRSIDFVFSKKNFFIDFLDELELFIGEKQVFTKKKSPSLCRLPREFKAVQILSAQFPFKLDTSPFGSQKELV